MISLSRFFQVDSDVGLLFVDVCFHKVYWFNLTVKLTLTVGFCSFFGHMNTSVVWTEQGVACLHVAPPQDSGLCFVKCFISIFLQELQIHIIHTSSKFRSILRTPALWRFFFFFFYRTRGWGLQSKSIENTRF